LETAFLSEHTSVCFVNMYPIMTCSKAHSDPLWIECSVVFQMKILLSKKESGMPLYLSLACEELRVFGIYEKVTWYIFIVCWCH